MDDFERKMAEQEERLSKMEADLNEASTEADHADAECHRSFSSNVNDTTGQRRQPTPEEMKQAQENLEKAGLVAVKSVATVAAVVGAGVVSLFKRDTSPISKTFDWCKENWWN